MDGYIITPKKNMCILTTALCSNRQGASSARGSGRWCSWGAALPAPPAGSPPRCPSARPSQRYAAARRARRSWRSCPDFWLIWQAMVSLYLFVYLSIYFFSWLVSQFAICSSDYVYNHMYIYIYRCVYMYKKKYKHTCMHIYIYIPDHTIPYHTVALCFITLQYNTI